MRLDQTFISIRERDLLETFDLAILVTRQHLRNLLALLLLNALPWALFDWLVLFQYAAGVDAEASGYLFYFQMTLLVVSQASIGTALITGYLGQAMFVERQTIGQTYRQFFRKPVLFGWVHGVVRLVVPIAALLVLANLNIDSPAAGFCVFMAVLLIGVQGLIRAFRPFVNEVVMLEKTPYQRTADGRINFKTRMKALHQGAADFTGRSLAMLFFAPLLFFSLFGSFCLADYYLLLQAGIDFPLKTIYWSIALWMVAGFAAVVRFLFYIDTRIRQEGWAIELKMRAEGLRLSGQEAR